MSLFLKNLSWRYLVLSGLLSWTLLNLGCVKVDDSSGVTLYVFDGATHSVMAWDDLSTIYKDGTASTANRTIKSSSMDFTLGWGGMAFDRNSYYLYLVSTDGVVVRIHKANSQNGTLTSTSDIITFNLDDAGTDAAGAGVYGQAAVNPSGDLLFITESNTSSSNSQTWVIPISLMANGTSLSSSSVTLIGNTYASGGVSDKACTGVSASSNQVFAYFNKGGSISPNNTDTYTASRLRMGTSSGFAATSNVIVGASDSATTRLGKYGCLCYDTSNDLLYLARHNTDSPLSGNPLVMFRKSSFNPGFEVAPDATFGGPNDLRVIAHAGSKDWIVGAESSDNANGTNTLWIWKDPSTGDSHTYVSLPTDVAIYGLALDGGD